MCQHLLGKIHVVFIVPVGCVVFEHGEFLKVGRVHAFIAEASGEFIDALEAADDCAFQVELRGDTEVDGEVQGFMVSFEWAGGGAGCFCGEDGGFNFQKIVFVQVIAK